MMFKQLPTMISELNKLGIALKALDGMNLATVGVNTGNLDAFRSAIKGLSTEQAVFALASKGATEEQIRQILITKQSEAADIEAALAKAGLTTATVALNGQEVIELAQRKGLTAERAKEIASNLGLIATEEGQVISKKQLTVVTLKQAGATDAEIASILGLNAAETANIGITNILTGAVAKLWAVITAHPIGAILTAVGAVAVGVIAYINKSNKDAQKAIIETHEKAQQALDDTKTALSDDKSELESVNSELDSTKQKIQDIASQGTITLTEQNELDKLSTASTQLETQKSLLENNIKLKQKSAALDAKNLLGTQVEMNYSDIQDGKDIVSHKESYTYAEHAEYEANRLENAYNIYMDALKKGDVEKQKLAQDLIDKTGGNTAELTSSLLEIVESFKYDDGTIIEGYEDLYNQYMGLIYNLQSLTNPEIFLDIAKQATEGTNIDYEKAISDGYAMAYDGKFDIDKLNQDFVKALADNGIDKSTIEYIFKLKQQEYQSVVDNINTKYNPDNVLRPNYLSEYGHVDTKEEIAQNQLDSQNYEQQKQEVQNINDELTKYAKKHPIEFQLISSYDENFSTLDKYIKEEKSKSESAIQDTKQNLENLSKNGNVDLTIRPVIDSSAMQAAGWDVEDGSIATTFTQGEFIWQGDEENGQYVYVHYTPITPDGKVMTPENMSDYLYGTLEGAQNILDADDKGLVLKVDTVPQDISEKDIKDLQKRGTQTASMKIFLGQMGQWDDSLHDVQAGYYLTGDSVDYVDKAVNRLVGDAKKAKGEIPKTPISFTDFLNISDDNDNSLNKKISEYKTKISEIAGYLNTLYDGDATSDTLSEIAQKYGIVANSTEEYIEKLEKLQKTDKNSVIKDIDDDISQCDKTLDKDVIDKLKQLKIIIENYYNDTNSKMSEIKRVKEDIDELSEVQKKVKKGHIFSLDEMSTLIDKYPDLKKAVIECSNGYKIESETLKDVMNSSKESANAIISDEIRKTKIILKNTQANITAYEGQLLAYEGLVTALDTGQPGNAKAVEAFMNALDMSDKIDSEKKKFKKTKEKLHELEKLFTQTISTSGSTSEKKSADKSEKSIETIDFIEIKIKRLESAISKLKSKAEDTTKSLGSRIKNYSSAISKTTSEIIVQQKAYDKYMSKANNVAKKYNLSRSTISKIQNGSIDIKDYSDTTAKHIKSYQDFYEKAIACKDAINELKLSEQALMHNKLQLHIDHYKNLYDSIGTSIDKINNRISLKESANQTVTKSDYKGLATYYNKQYAYLDKQNSYLVRLQHTVKKGSEEWYNYKSQINSNNASIRDLTSSIIDNANAMAELNKQVAEKKVEKLDSKDKYSDAKITNATSYKTKNSLIDNKIGNISLRQKAYDNAVRQDNADLNSYKFSIMKRNVKGDKNLRKIKSYVKSNKAIPVSLIEKLTNKKLATSCANYNATLQAHETDKETAKLYKETSKTDRANLAVDKFNNISTNYDNNLSVYTQRAQEIEDFMDLNTSKGYKTSANYYNNSINNELNNYNKLIKKRHKLQSSLNESLKNGMIKIYDDNWWEMTNDINNVTNAIAQSKKQLVEYNNTLKEIEWNRFDDLQSAIKGFASENNFMIKELSRQDLADDDIGKLTKNGNAVMALHNSNYEVYTKSAQKYVAKIQEINKELKNDPGNTKLIEEKEKLVSAYQESISSAQDEKDAIIDLTKNGYTSLQNKIKDLIDDYTKLLDKQKNAYDYSNSINEKTEKIANLRKQLEAYSGDISEEGKAKIQSISVSLKDAEKDLQSTQYDKYISDTKDMLSELQDSLSDEIDKIIKSLKDNFNTIHIDVKDAARTITNEKKAIGYQSSSDFSKLTSDFAKGSDIGSATDKVINAITSRQDTINEIADNKGNIQKLNDQRDFVQKFIKSESRNKSKTTSAKSLADTNKALYGQYKKVLTFDQWKELGKLLGITIKSKKDLTANSALYKKLKELGIQGFSVGSHKIDKNQLALLAEEGMELHFDKSRGVLKTIGEGDKIFTNEMTENLWKLAQQNPVNFKDMSIVPILPSVNNSSSKGNVNIDIGNITLPSVTKPEEFAGALKDTIKTNSSVQKQLQELTIGTLNKNNNSLGIRRF